MRRDCKPKAGSPREDAKTLGARVLHQTKKGRGSQVLSSPMRITTKKGLWFLASGSLPASPRLASGIPSPRCGEPLSACLPSLCLALVDEQRLSYCLTTKVKTVGHD